MLVDPICADHGWIAHATCHEASHAIAAVERGIPFSAVKVLRPDQWITHSSSGFFAGGVYLDTSPADWVPGQPVAAMEFCLAGACGERATLGHHLDGCFKVDIEIWRSAMGLTDGGRADLIEAALGESMPDIAGRVARWADERIGAIRKVALALVGRNESSLGERQIVEYSDDWELTEHQVKRLLKHSHG